MAASSSSCPVCRCPPASRLHLYTVVLDLTSQFPARPHILQRKLLQTPGAALPFPPLKVLSNGEPCLLFQARKLSIRFDQRKPLDLTERAFSPLKSVDISQSVCDKDKATLVMRFGDVEDVRGLFIRIHLSNSFSQSSGQRWFSVDSLSLSYNVSEEVMFNISDIYAPSSSSYHCLHVSSLHRLSALLRPCTDHAHLLAVTFTHFQIQAFNVSSGHFSPPTDCSTVVTPAILMGLVTSLILLLVLAYALHMVVHLKDIDHNQEHKDNVYSPRHLQQPEHCSGEDITLTNAL
ncbi:V-type proton ATPase subunit S1-like protein isoform X2 [Sphaeramia orbicularis]|uniref:V-type proton ATPase subunit S1-like protein isoform X2 n=1 Tax=Sphaeramia orbicularis TaxID=375764 RepID=UPI00117C8ECC|nr:V-type proton ATPase subunit S1-like protein isoform X2 [Sphaeramia orbicularis]